MKGKSKRACRNNKEWRSKCREHVFRGDACNAQGRWVSRDSRDATVNFDATTHHSMRAGYGLGRG